MSSCRWQERGLGERENRSHSMGEFPLWSDRQCFQKYRRCIVQFDMGIIIFSTVSFAVLQMYTSIVSVSNYCLGTRFAYRYN